MARWMVGNPATVALSSVCKRRVRSGAPADATEMIVSRGLAAAAAYTGYCSQVTDNYPI